MNMDHINAVLLKTIRQFQEGEISALSTILEKEEPRGVTIKKAGKLDAVDPIIAKVITTSGLKDGSVKDDIISVSKKTWSAASLKPSQTTMVLDKALGMALGMLSTGKVGGDLGAIISSDKQIMDGHHRWAATILASGKKGKVGGYGAAMPGKQLIRLLNIITKGAFNVRQGKAGKGSLAMFTPKNVSSKLKDFAQNGIGGDFPVSAETIQETLKNAFGSIEKGIETMSQHANLISKKVPAWAPDRKQMPVINPGQVSRAAQSLIKGKIDWKPPFYKEK